MACYAGRGLKPSLRGLAGTDECGLQASPLSPRRGWNRGKRLSPFDGLRGKDERADLSVGRGNREQFSLSSRRPSHGAAAQKVQVQVIHRLPAVGADVYHHAIALAQSLLPRNLRRRAQQVP